MQGKIIYLNKKHPISAYVYLLFRTQDYSLREATINLAASSFFLKISSLLLMQTQNKTYRKNKKRKSSTLIYFPGLVCFINIARFYLA